MQTAGFPGFAHWEGTNSRKIEPTVGKQPFEKMSKKCSWKDYKSTKKVQKKEDKNFTLRGNQISARLSSEFGNNYLKSKQKVFLKKCQWMKVIGMYPKVEKPNSKQGKI